MSGETDEPAKGPIEPVEPMEPVASVESAEADGANNKLKPPRRFGLLPDRALLDSIWQMTWPQVLMLLCQFAIGMADVWAGGQLGADVQASIGLIAQCQTLLMVLAFATASGAVAAISQSLGAGRMRRATRYVGLVLCGGSLFALVLALAGYAFSLPLLRLIQTPEAMLPTATLFLGAYLWSLPGQYVLSLGGAVFRSAKSVLNPLYVAGLVCLVNVFGDLAFGLGWWGFPAYGAQGIAWATVVSVTAGALAMLVLLVRAGLVTRHSFVGWRWIRAGGAYLVRVSGPALGTSLLWQSGYMVLFVIVASLPAGSVSALAGLTAGFRIEAILFLPAVAFNMTAAVLVGHCLGEGRKHEAKTLALTILGLSCFIMSLVAACLWPFRQVLAAFLSPDPQVQVETINYLLFNILSAPFTVGSVVLAGALNGAGASVYPLTVFSSAVWLVRLPLAWFLGHVLWRDATGVFAAMLVSQIVQSVSLFWIVTRADWTRFAMKGASGNRRTNP